MIPPYICRSPTEFTLISSEDSEFQLFFVSRMQSLLVSVRRFLCSPIPTYHSRILIPFAISRSFVSLSVIHLSELLSGMFG